jgi:hypothetical protein
MSRPYYGRPATVAPYRRHRAPPSVRIVALFQGLTALLLLAAAGVVVALARGVTGNPVVDRVPDSIRRGLGAGSPVIAGTLVVLGLFWLMIARALWRGRQWARTTVLVLSLLGLATALYLAGLRHDPRVLIGLIAPGLYAMLLGTEAARSWFRRDGR